MSSDETAVDSEDNESADCDSDHPATERTTKNKKLRKHRHTWRSQEMQQMMIEKTHNKRPDNVFR